MIARTHRFPTNPRPDRTEGLVGAASATSGALQRAERFYGVVGKTPQTSGRRLTLDERMHVRRAPSFAAFPSEAAKAHLFRR